jgi:protocatechuate 3,4-dioxygenase beta subunit
MPDYTTPDETRRQLLRVLAVTPLALAAPTLLGLASCASDATGASDTSNTDGSATPTLACSDGDDDEPTISETEGPYFKASSPERPSLLESGMAGTPLVVTGTVMTRSCKPVAGALLDFWHADNSGNYDNTGFRLRGHQFTDAQGVYRLETIIPGLYPGRTRHIHVKAQAPSRPILTTQLYFPGESRNGSDGLFHSSLLLQMTDITGGRQGRFNFVLDLP